MTILFWISLIVVFYIFAGYPVFIYVMALLRPRPVVKSDIKLPVSIVMAVYNEEKVIAEKIRNLISLDYSSDLAEIIIVSDGSTDNTVELIRSFSDDRIKLITLEERKGKPFCLNKAVDVSQGKIICFTDARQILDKNALSNLVANFKDKTVGVVSGELLFYDDMKTVTGEGLDIYWKYEKFLRKNESKVDSTTGATGAIYAIRRKLYHHIQEDILLDDVVIPMNAVLQGYRCVFDPEAKAYDDVADTDSKEERRKIRTIAGNVQMFARYREYLNPFRNRIFFQTFSHKFLRLLAPVFLLLLIVSNLSLYGRPAYNFLLGSQGIFYLFGFLGYISRGKDIQIKLFSAPYAFIMLNLFTVKAFSEYITKASKDLWIKE